VISNRSVAAELVDDTDDVVFAEVGAAQRRACLFSHQRPVAIGRTPLVPNFILTKSSAKLDTNEPRMERNSAGEGWVVR
jgi:hypothetical protein